MLLRKLNLFFICIIISTSSLATPSLKNLYFVKQNYISYHDSGSYADDIAKVDKQALDYLKKRLAKTSPSEKLALVLDIDESSLSNYPNMVAMDFGGTYKQIDEAEGQGNDPAIESTLEIFRFAKAHHVSVFFITGRHEKYRLVTERNLAAAGFIDPEGLIMKPNDYHEKSVIPYKSGARKSIMIKGYKIILNIGDQNSDLAGGYAEKTFKLPNPYYMIF